MAKRSLRTKRNLRKVTRKVTRKVNRKVNRKNTKRKIRRSIKKSKQQKRINNKYSKRKNVNYRGGAGGFTVPGSEPGSEPVPEPGSEPGFSTETSAKNTATSILKRLFRRKKNDSTPKPPKKEDWGTKFRVMGDKSNFLDELAEQFETMKSGNDGEVPSFKDFEKVVVAKVTEYINKERIMDTGRTDRVMAGLGPVGFSIFMFAVTLDIAGPEIGTTGDLIVRKLLPINMMAKNLSKNRGTPEIISRSFYNRLTRVPYDYVQLNLLDDGGCNLKDLRVGKIVDIDVINEKSSYKIDQMYLDAYLNSNNGSNELIYDKIGVKEIKENGICGEMTEGQVKKIVKDYNEEQRKLDPELRDIFAAEWEKQNQGSEISFRNKEDQDN